LVGLGLYCHDSAIQMSYAASLYRLVQGGPAVVKLLSHRWVIPKSETRLYVCHCRTPEKFCAAQV